MSSASKSRRWCWNTPVPGLHDLRSRHSGTMTFIQLHRNWTHLSLSAYQISDEVEENSGSLSGSEIIFTDPQSVVGHEAVAEFHDAEKSGE